MRDNSVILRLNRSKPVLYAVLALVFLLMLYCNMKTGMIADDYRYCFSFADDSRIESVMQIFPSMAAHRESMNGRLVAHFLVQLFLLLPGAVFDVCNAAMFTLLVWLIYRLAKQKCEDNAVFAALIFACLWCLQPSFGQVFLWLDGSINYLWCAVLCLLLLREYTLDFLYSQTFGKLRQVYIIVLSFLVGAYSENSAVALIFMLMLFMLIKHFYKREKVPVWMFVSLAVSFIGFFWMMLAPAESVNKSAEFSILVLWNNFLECGSYYLRFFSLLCVYALAYPLCRREKTDVRLRILSAVLLLGSLAGQFVLMLAMYCTGRSTYIALFLLILAVMTLLFPLFCTKWRTVILLVCILALLFCAVMVLVGVRDILQTNYSLTYNEDFIRDCVSNGETDITVGRPYAATDYCALQGLPYLSLEDASDWSNVYMAKYFGLKSILAD